jgi:transposase
MSTHTSTGKISTLEVIQTGARRRWTPEEKQRIVAESLSGPRLVKPTARRYGLSTGQLYLWRRLAREGKLVREDEDPGFVPAIVARDNAGDTSVGKISLPSSDDCGAGVSGGRMVIVLSGGLRVIVGSDVDVGVLRRVLEVLDQR